MSVNLEKGAKVSLEKEGGESLKKVAIGLGWDTAEGGQDFDLDASLYMLNADGKCPAPGQFVYFNNLKSSDGSVVHTGDNLTGEGEGDDETINVDLEAVPADIVKLVVIVNIFQAQERGQNFGQVENSFARIINLENNEEMMKFDLQFDASAKDGVQFCTLVRRDGKWIFSADNIPFDGGLSALNTKYGL